MHYEDREERSANRKIAQYSAGWRILESSNTKGDSHKKKGYCVSLAAETTGLMAGQLISFDYSAMTGRTYSIHTFAASQIKEDLIPVSSTQCLILAEENIQTKHQEKYIINSSLQFRSHSPHCHSSAQEKLTM